jgi:hypothetical protein
MLAFFCCDCGGINLVEVNTFGRRLLFEHLREGRSQGSHTTKVLFYFFASQRCPVAVRPGTYVDDSLTST